jgi:hypothetical protein
MSVTGVTAYGGINPSAFFVGTGCSRGGIGGTRHHRQRLRSLVAEVAGVGVELEVEHQMRHAGENDEDHHGPHERADVDVALFMARLRIDDVVVAVVSVIRH